MVPIRLTPNWRKPVSSFKHLLHTRSLMTNEGEVSESPSRYRSHSNANWCILTQLSPRANMVNFSVSITDQSTDAKGCNSAAFAGGQDVHLMEQ
eukprot:469118-Amphidinium_carterae.1